MITAEEIIAKVRELAAEQPEFVYPSNTDRAGGMACLYTADDEQPGCIFGQAFASFNIPTEPLETEAIANAWRHLLNNGLVGPPAADQARWMDRVQTFQDTGAEWAYAVQRADELALED